MKMKKELWNGQWAAWDYDEKMPIMKSKWLHLANEIANMSPCRRTIVMTCDNWWCGCKCFSLWNAWIDFKLTERANSLFREGKKMRFVSIYSMHADIFKKIWRFSSFKGIRPIWYLLNFWGEQSNWCWLLRQSWFVFDPNSLSYNLTCSVPCWPHRLLP